MIKRFIFTIFLVILVGLVYYFVSLQSLKKVIYYNYVSAVEKGGTVQCFIVIKVRDLNTGLIKEICTFGDMLDGAIMIETKKYNLKVDMFSLNNLQIKNISRYFEFKNRDALNNIGFFDYPIQEYYQFEKNNNIDSLAGAIKNCKWEKWIVDDKLLLFYAHSLFNRGILTCENICFGGTLEKTTRKELEAEKKEIQDMIENSSREF